MSIFYQVTETESSDFKAAIAIYEEAFPEKERASTSFLAEKIRTKSYQLFVKLENNQIVFVAILCEPILEKFVLLGYLATHAHFRNRGLGTSFMKETLTRLAHQSQYLLLEVEDPTFGSDRELRKRRVNFYHRLGAKQMKDVRYILPPLRGGESTEMILMLASEYPENRIAGESVKELITQIYVRFYDRPQDDPLLQSILQTIGEFVELIS